MKHRILQLCACGLLVMALATSEIGAQEYADNKHVNKRIAMMMRAQEAVATLADMMAGRIAFRAGKAQSARRVLIQTSRSISKQFKTPHQDPASNARPEIWMFWSDFDARADSALASARQLNVYSLNGLRRSLPHVMQNCLGCHDRYRTEPREFTTH